MGRVTNAAVSNNMKDVGVIWNVSIPSKITCDPTVCGSQDTARTQQTRLRLPGAWNLLEKDLNAMSEMLRGLHRSKELKRENHF